MPEKRTIQRARRAKREGKAPTTQAGEFVREMTIVTRVTLKEGAEPQWDDAVRERMRAARDQAGWIGGQIMIPLDGPNRRVIIGTWQTRAHWEAWHSSLAARRTAEPDPDSVPAGHRALTGRGPSRPPSSKTPGAR